MLRKKGKMFLGFTVIFALFGVVEENVFFFSLFELPLSLHDGDNAAGPGGAGKMGRLWRASARLQKGTDRRKNILFSFWVFWRASSST